MKNKELHITRNDTEYIYPLDDKVYPDLKEYASLRSSMNASDEEALFVSYTGSPYTIRAYQLRFKEALVNSDIDGYYTPRNVRASFCYAMAKSTDEERLKLILNQTKVEHYYIKEIAKNNNL